jgi:hypothetical protein
MRSPVFKPWRLPRLTGRQSWNAIPATYGTTSTFVWARGRITEIVSDTHKSADFITFLKKLDTAYAPHQKIRLMLDHHSAHLSKETRNYLETVPPAFHFHLHTDPRDLAESHREPIQQNDANHATGHSCGHQTGTN